MKLLQTHTHTQKKHMKDLTPEVYVGDDVFEQVDVLDGHGKQLFLILNGFLSAMTTSTQSIIMVIAGQPT